MKNYTLTIRYMAAVYGTKKLPPCETIEEANNAAQEHLSKFSAKLKYTITDEEAGTTHWFEMGNEESFSTQGDRPVMTVGGKAVRFDVE